MSYDDLLNRIEEEAAAAAGVGSGVSAPGSEGATTEDNVAYLPSQLGVVKPGKKKRKKRPVEEGDDYLPMLQQRMRDAYREATKSDMMKTSKYSGEEHQVKLWVLNDGSMIHVPYSHAALVEDLPGTFSLDDLLDDGAIRIASKPNGQMFLNYEVDPTEAQIESVMGIARLHDTDMVIYDIGDGDSDDFPVRSFSDIGRFMRGEEVRKPSLAAAFHEAVEEGEHDLPDVQQELLDANNPAKSDRDMWINSQIEDELFIKFWLLSDGTFVPMPEGHLRLLTMSDYHELKDTGAIRISSDPRKELALDYSQTPNSDQIIALQNLAGLHHTANVVIEVEDNSEIDLDKRGDVIALKSPKDLSRILRGQGNRQSLAAQFHESLDEGGPEPSKGDVLRALCTLPTATNRQLSQKADYSGEEVVKLWIAPDGNVYWNPEAHWDVLGDVSKMLSAGHISYTIAKGYGLIRVNVDIDGQAIGLDFTKRPTSDQILAVQGLVKMHDVKHVVLDQEGEDVPISSSSEVSDIMRGRVKKKSLAAQFHEAMEDEMTKRRQDLKPAIIRLFEGDPFHLVETDAKLWASRFGVDKYLSADAPLVSVENKVRGVQNLAGTLLQNYGNDRGYLEMLIDAMSEREPLSSFDGFKENDYLYGTRIRSNHEGVEMVFEAALDPLYVVSETVYVDDDDVLDRWEGMASGIKRVGNVVYPQGERFTPGTLQQLEHAIIDAIDDQEELE